MWSFWDSLGWLCALATEANTTCSNYLFCDSDCNQYSICANSLGEAVGGCGFVGCIVFTTGTCFSNAHPDFCQSKVSNACRSSTAQGPINCCEPGVGFPSSTTSVSPPTDDDSEGSSFSSEDEDSPSSRLHEEIMMDPSPSSVSASSSSDFEDSLSPSPDEELDPSFSLSGIA
jgi:hypothetical protein